MPSHQYAAPFLEMIVLFMCQRNVQLQPNVYCSWLFKSWKMGQTKHVQIFSPKNLHLFLGYSGSRPNALGSWMYFRYWVVPEVWGADRSCLLKFDRALIRFCLDYGSIVYSSARRCVLKMLDTVHHSAVHLSEPYLQFSCRSWQTVFLLKKRIHLNYFFSHKAKPDNPAYEIVFQNHLAETFLRRPNAPHLFGIHCQSYLQWVSGFAWVPGCSVALAWCTSVPPWTITWPLFDLSLACHAKPDSPGHICQSRFREILGSLRLCDIVYTYRIQEKKCCWMSVYNMRLDV